MSKRFLQLILMVLILAGSLNSVCAQKMPFPQFKNYGLRPSGSEAQLQAAVIKEYERYKKFLSKKDNMYYILSGETVKNKKTITVSEAHGYGMVIMAIMAGADPLAKTYFDGMFEFWKKYQQNNIMNWRVYTDFSSDKSGGATDGDLDIAYALLLASQQWPENKSYLTTAEDIIDEVWSSCMNPSTKLPRIDNLGSEPNATRPSDWMGDHFRVFSKYNSSFSSSAAAIYKFYSSNSNSTTGLVPDFYVGTSPADPDFLETENDGKYYYNACRVPLRFAMDYATSNDEAAKNATKKLADFAASQAGTKIDVNKIYSGYDLNGRVIKDEDYSSLETMGPFGAAQIVTKNQALMDSIWKNMDDDTMGLHDPKTTVSYGEALGLMSMLVMSGNWWKPGDSNTNKPATGLCKDGFCTDVNGISAVNSSVSNHNGTLQISCTPNSAGVGSVKIYSLAGREIATRSFQAIPGVQTYSLGEMNISQGIYVAQTTVCGTVSTQRIEF